MTSDPIPAFPSLREVLDAGGDFEALMRAEGRWDSIAEVLFIDIARHIPWHRAEYGAQERMLHEVGMPLNDDGVPAPASFEHRRRWSWVCDLWEHADLYDRVMSSLSAEALEEGRELAAKYLELALKIVVESRNEDHPYWECVSCGRPFDLAVPAIVTGEDEEPNCRDCVAAVLERFDRGEVDAREEASK